MYFVNLINLNGKWLLTLLLFFQIFHSIEPFTVHCADKEPSSHQVEIEEFISDLPIMVLEYDPDDPSLVRISAYYSPNGSNTLSSPSTQECTARIDCYTERAGTGKSTLRFDIVSNTDSDTPGTVPLLGLPAGSGWLLKGSTQDREMLRNGIAYALGSIICPQFTPENR